MCRKMDTHRSDPDRRSVCELTLIVSFHAAHPSFISKTGAEENSINFSKCWLMTGIDVLSIYTSTVDMQLVVTHRLGIVDSNVQGSSLRELCWSLGSLTKTLKP